MFKFIGLKTIVMNMKWQFNFSVGQKNFIVEAEVICTTYQIEQIKISGSNIAIVIQNNRPLLEAIELKRPLTWRIIHGEMKDQAMYNTIREKVELHLAKSGPARQPEQKRLIA
jgi:hypothetical protein